MARLSQYLTFNGNCKEAMEFYQKCLGGKLDLMKVKGSPMEQGASPDKLDKILHSALMNDNLLLMASDVVMEGQEFKPGNTVTLALLGDSKEELTKLFNAFAEGGNITQPLEEAFFGTYGELTDKFGVRWMFQYGTGDMEEK